MKIHDWAPANRPRERLLSDGPQSLSDAELLAIFLRTGTRGLSAVDVANQLLKRFGHLSGVLTASQEQFCSQGGLGITKYVTIQAIHEVARRTSLFAAKQGDVLSDPASVENFVRQWLRHKPHEVFGVLLLNSQNQLIEPLELFRGTINQAAVYPREVVKACLEKNASHVILVHNHPSGCAEPSQADLHLTEALRKALDLIDVRLLDHFIVAGAYCYSMAKNGHI